MSGFETIGSNNPITPDQPEKEKELAKREEAMLSASALAVKELQKQKFKEDLTGVKEEDIESAFDELQLSPEDFVKSNMAQIKEILGHYDLAKDDAKKIKELVAKSWTQISNMNNGEKNPEINRMSNYLLSVEQYLDERKA